MTESEILAFLSVVKNGTISGAAEELYLSQPALSRRLTSLEEQLGCTLLVRHKGQRYVELTQAGKSFVSLAQRWQALLGESKELALAAEQPALRMGSVGSVCNILLPPVLQRFLEDCAECRLHIFQHHSSECYEHVADGSLDFALISDDVYNKSVETVPAFKSDFYFLSRRDYESETVRVEELDAGREIRLPWTPEYDLWHDYWFGTAAKAHIVLDQMPLLGYFLVNTDSWAAAPAYIAQYMHKRHGVVMRRFNSPPPEEIIYYLQPKELTKINSYNSSFLTLLKELLPVYYPEITVLL